VSICDAAKPCSIASFPHAVKGGRYHPPPAPPPWGGYENQRCRTLPQQALPPGYAAASRANRHSHQYARLHAWHY
jgi:hypothetical protein